MNHVLTIPARWRLLARSSNWLRKFIRNLRPVERYIVRARHEWAIIYIDERNGAFMCQSSFGTYCYIWTHIGDRTLKEFLRGLNFDYFMGKTRKGYREFDFDLSCKSLREYICRRRREGTADKDAARRAYDDVEWLSLDSEQAFVASISDSAALEKLVNYDFSNLCRESPDGDSRGFWEVIWPEFLKQIGGKR